MNELKVFLEFLSKLSLKDVATHLDNIVNLYKKPLHSWKRIISYRKSSYNYFLLFIIYYCVLLFFILEDSKYVLPITILELLLTLVPFCILIIPFLIYRKKWCKRLKSNRLFRLLFIIKIQFNVILLILILLAKWSEVELLYIAIHNYSAIILLAIIIIPPLIINLKVYQKLLWISTNYLFLLLYFVCIYFIIFLLPEINKIESKISIDSPTIDYQKFTDIYSYSDMWMDNKYYMIVLTDLKDRYVCRNTQFATIPLVLQLMKINSNDLKRL